jgi:aryl-alcohol dehydrogenase-like predicted oxidoreductase
MTGSLERLQLDYVDLVYAHRPDRETPIEETVRAFNYLIDTGKAFYWGTSEWNADEIATAWRVADRLNLIGPLMEQPEYNMLTREKVEREFVGQIEMTGLGLTVFSPLKQGFLTGKYNDRISEDSRLATSTDGAVTGFAAALKTKEGRTNIELVRKLKVSYLDLLNRGLLHISSELTTICSPLRIN